MRNFIEKYSTTVLIDKSPYNVLLDDNKDPRQMWSPGVFTTGTQVIVEGRPYVVAQRKLIEMGVYSYRLRTNV